MALVSSSENAGTERTPNSRQDTRYVVVVHGIGVQRKNETVLPVINRFAEARRGGSRPANPLSLGVLSTYREYGEWIEFAGIPRHPCASGDTLPPFVGRRLKEPQGENLRFVDLHWADVMEEQFGDVGEPLDSWSSALIERLNRRRAKDWILQFLGTMRRGLIPLQRILNLRFRALSTQVFNRFLGDVQLYGEFGPTRGRGIRRFHEVLDKIYQKHNSSDDAYPGTPRFAVIAHSLGTVMAFDALLFAHAQRGPGNSDGLDYEKLGLAGYKEPSGEPLPKLDWIRNVDSFVTLGSPIDKYLVLWWLSYRHLVETSWMDDGLLNFRRSHPILHYNYCDEQDPVGHELDVAYSAPTVKEIFRKEEERVFTRYSTPGVAHIRYWEDGELFARILDLVVDGKSKEEPSRPILKELKTKLAAKLGKTETKREEAAEEEAPPPVAHQVQWFQFGTYIKALVWSYLLLPVIGWFISSFAMVWALDQNLTWRPRVLLVLVSLGVLTLTLWVMTLMVRWRILLRDKRLRSKSPMSRTEHLKRGAATRAVHLVIGLLPLAWLYGLAAALFAVRPGWTIGFLGLDSVAALLRQLPERLRLIEILGWRPDALAHLEPAAFRAGLVVILAFALVIAVWNLAVFAWTKWRWRSFSWSLDFPTHLADDPTKTHT